MTNLRDRINKVNALDKERTQGEITFYGNLIKVGDETVAKCEITQTLLHPTAYLRWNNTEATDALIELFEEAPEMVLIIKELDTKLTKQEAWLERMAKVIEVLAEEIELHKNFPDNCELGIKDSTWQTLIDYGTDLTEYQ